MKRRAEPAPRVRRSGEDAKSAILDAAERRLIASGMAGIRLQEVAADVGVGHPTILHHFGSRERLVGAVLQRRIDAMNAEVLAAVSAGSTDRAVIEPLLARLFTVFADGGHARVVAYLALEGQGNPGLDGVHPIVRALHALWSASAPKGLAPSKEDSEFVVLLTSFALFGEAIAGPLFRCEPPDAPDLAARERFLTRLTTLVERLIAPPSGSASPEPPAPRRRRAKTP